MASTYLQRTQGTATNRNIFTVSMWVKHSKLGSQTSAHQYMDFYVSADIRISIYQMNSDQLAIYMKGGGYADNIFYTTAKYRDTSAWYHFVWRFDTTQSTAADRVRMYVNGEQVTDFVSTNYPAQNFNLQQGTSSYTHYIGRYGGGTTNYFDGYMSHVHFCDGYSYAPTEFGETDSTTGEWKIKTSPSVSYGNNGFFILKDGNSVTDQSGQGNNLTVGGGTLTKTEDNPSNVFATWNPLDHKSTGWNMQNGNTRLQGTGGDTWETRRAISTIGASSGKYYAEQKMTTAGNDSYPFGVGYDVFELSYSSSMGSNSNFWGYYQPSGGQIYGGGTGSPLETSLGGGTGDVIGIALDIDNLTLQFYKNGSTMGSQITGLPSGKTWFFASSGYGNTNTFDCNFGNGYFGTTAVASAGTNASGIGIFEHDVPNGYTSLSTKGLNL